MLPVDPTLMFRSHALRAVSGTDFAGALRDQAKVLFEYLPIVPAADKSLVLNPPGERLSFGKRRVKGKTEAVIVVEDDKGGAAAAAATVAGGADKGSVARITVGRAFSSWPTAQQSGGSRGASASPGGRIEDWRPGKSVSHVAAFAGSLGALVDFKYKKKTLRGFVGSAHVLAPPGGANNGDPILSPAPPDVPRNKGLYGVATLRSWIELVHYKSQLDAPVLNETDIAAAEILDITDLPDKNLVPHPSDPVSKTLALKKVVEFDELLALSEGEEVFMSGRTTDFAVGKIVVVQVTPFTIRLPDGKAYMYSNVVVVAPTDAKRGFSAGGDSGAPVYTKGGGLVGFIVGGSGTRTFVHPAVSCLEAVGAELVVE